MSHLHALVDGFPPEVEVSELKTVVFCYVIEVLIVYRQRLCLKPGITGWAQINHKYGDTVEDSLTKLEYDLYYVKNMSLVMDLIIIFHTAKTVLLGRGSR